MYFIFKNKNRQGFTLLEFLVSISIGMVILVGVVIGQEKYNDLAALKIQANDAAALLRQAQIYGLSEKESAVGSNNFRSAYGLNFNISWLNSYYYFADPPTSGNHIYDGTYGVCDQECIQMITLSRGNKLVNPFCRVALDNTETCDVERIDITYARPSTEASIYAYSNSNGSLLSMNGYKGVRVKFISPRGRLRSVVVYSSGQISIQ